MNGKGQERAWTPLKRNSSKLHETVLMRLLFKFGKTRNKGSGKFGDEVRSCKLHLFLRCVLQVHLSFASRSIYAHIALTISTISRGGVTNNVSCYMLKPDC